MQKIILKDPESGNMVAAPVEIWLGSLLMTLPPEWLSDVIGECAERMANLPKEQPRIVTART